MKLRYVAKEDGRQRSDVGDTQITPVPSPGATPVKWLPDFTGQAGQAQITRIRKKGTEVAPVKCAALVMGMNFMG